MRIPRYSARPEKDWYILTALGGKAQGIATELRVVQYQYQIGDISITNPDPYP